MLAADIHFLQKCLWNLASECPASNFTSLTTTVTSLNHNCVVLWSWEVTVVDREVTVVVSRGLGCGLERLQLWLERWSLMPYILTPGFKDILEKMNISGQIPDVCIILWWEENFPLETPFKYLDLLYYYSSWLNSYLVLGVLVYCFYQDFDKSDKNIKQTAATAQLTIKQQQHTV